MRYMLLIYGGDATGAPATKEEQEEQRAELAAWFAYDDALQEAGKLVVGEALHPTSTATVVRVDAGRTLTSDGPFAETKEQLGGFYLIDADDLDDAVAWAAKMPEWDGGAVEVRPVIEFERP